MERRGIVFGRKAKKLEEALQQERMTHARDLQEFHALRSGIDSEKQSLKKAQDDYQQKLKELEIDKITFQEERARLFQEFDTEVSQRQNALDEEIRLRKQLAEEQIRKDLTALQDNYSYYLAQLKLLMDVLTNVSITVGETVLTQEDTDTAELFQTLFRTQLDSKDFPLTRQKRQTEDAPGGPEGGGQVPIPGREETL